MKAEHLDSSLSATLPGAAADPKNIGASAGRQRIYTAGAAGGLILVMLCMTISVSAQDTLTNGSTHNGAISPAGVTNTWTFTANTGDNIVVRAGEVTETGGRLGFTPALRLYGPSGALLDSDVGNFNATEVAVRATTSGTFTVAVSDGGSYADGTGTYRLHFVKAPGTLAISAGDEGGALTNGVTHEGSIHLGDLDAWNFSASAGDNIVVRAAEVTDTGGTLGFTPALQLYGPDGALLDSDVGNLNAAEVAARATTSGTFTVVVSDGGSYIDGTGTYRLHLAKMPGAFVVSSGDEGGALTNGSTHEGSIHLGDLDMWSFSANAGDNIVLRAGEVADTGGTLGFTPALRLYGPDGALLDSDVGNLNATEVAVRATTSGTFTVLVSDGGSYIDGTGTYRLHFVKAPGTLVISAGDEGGSLTNGVTHEGSIHLGDLDAWSFSASAGDNMVVRAGEVTDTGGTLGFTPALRLYGPDGALLDSDVGNLNAAEVAVRATTSGTFTVVVSDGGSYIDGTGTYRLYLFKTPGAFVVSSGDEGGALINGAAHEGTIHLGDLDAWSFSANSGDNMVVRAGEVTDTGGTLGFTAALRLYGPDGALLDTDVGNLKAAEVAVRAATSGIYTVVIGDGGPYIDGTGTYRLHLAKMPGAFIVSPGDEGGPMLNGAMHEGTIHAGDLDMWSFTGCAGDNLLLKIDEVTGGAGFVPGIRLYGRDGTLLNSAFGQTTAQISRPIPENGTYTVVISDGSTAVSGTGTYRLTGTGIATGLVLCQPVRAGANLLFSGAGGKPNGAFMVLMTTNIITPAAQWTPILTNQFGIFGEFSFSSLNNPKLREQYFQLLMP